MKFNVGDKVRFLDDIGGGVVTKVINAQTVVVLNEYDFEIPVSVDSLIKLEEKNIVSDFSRNSYFPESKVSENKVPEVKVPPKKEIIVQPPLVQKPQVVEIQEEEKEENFRKNTDEINVYYAFLPRDVNYLTECDLEAYLINDSNYDLSYLYGVSFGKYFSCSTGIIEPNTKILLETFRRETLSELKSVMFQLIFYNSILYPQNVKMPVERELKINSSRFYIEKRFVENDFFDAKAVIIPVLEENAMVEAIKRLSENDSFNIIHEKEVKNASINKPKQYKKPVNIEEEVIDLHITALLDNESGLSDLDKLQYQMKSFKDSLEKAIEEKKLKRIVFIHGVGNGTLRLELRRELERNYRQYIFQDASFKEYGYGATMVILR